MARLTEAIIAGAYARVDASERPMLDLQFGGQNGWAPNLTEYVSNQAYVSRPLICIVLETPKLFTVLPDSQKWISSVKALFELHAKTIDGLNAGLKVDWEEHAVGGAGEMQQEFVNVTRERSQPKFGFVEKYGRPIQTLLDYWIRYGMMDPDAKFALLGTLGKDKATDLLADWYTATMLFIEPDHLHRKVDKAWIVTNMAPQDNGEITSKRDLTSSQTMLTLDIPMTGIAQYGMGVNQFAQTILDSINITNADPYMKPAFIDRVSPDVAAVATAGYTSSVETVSKNAVTGLNN